MKRIDTKIAIAAPIEKVWGIFIDFPAWGNWNPFIFSISGNAVEGETLTFTAALPGGKAMTFSPKVKRVREKAELTWVGRLPVPGLFQGEHIFLFKDLGKGRTVVTQSEIFTGILPPFMPGMIKKTETGFIEMNNALKGRSEK